MLETTLSTEFVPGTNLSGDLACADWRFLLPRLQLENILILGLPSIAALTVLSTTGKRVSVVWTDHRGLRDLCSAAQLRGINNVNFLLVEDLSGLPFSSHTMDLIWLEGRGKPLIRPRSHHLLDEINRLLGPQGVVYFEIKGLRDSLLGSRAIKRLWGRISGTPQVYWQTSQNGEMRTAVPLDEPRIAAYFFTNVLFGQSAKKRVLSRVGRVIARAGLLPRVALGRVVLVRRGSEDGWAKHPPAYLVSLAETAGIDLTNHRCGLSARGTYNSNKVIFYLFENNKQVPAVVVKMTRTAKFNRRLEHEWRMLSLLEERCLVEPGTYPAPMFFGYHHSLAILGEGVVRGYPFRTRTEANVSCPLAQAAVDWIIRLGSSSADHAASAREGVGETLAGLLRRFVQIYKPSEGERNFLREQITALGSGRIPLVFQHGDPGTWNVMATENGKVAFLDWESAEPHGMPLWDLFYFMRSYGSWISRLRGKRDALASFARNFLNPSPLSAFLAEVTERYCDRVDLDKRFVEPLFYTCWMHRALKESILVPEASLERAHYFNLLRLCIRERKAPGLASLFSLASREGRKSLEEEGELVIE